MLENCNNIIIVSEEKAKYWTKNYKEYIKDLYRKLLI